MGNDHDTAPPGNELAIHLTQCAACRDDAADPIGRLLAHVSHDFALPPTNFTQQVLARLPHASPQQLVQQTQSRRRRVWALAAAPVAVLLVALAFGPTFQGLLAGSALGMLADTLRAVAGAAWLPLVVALGSAIGIMILFGRVLRTPTTRSALGAVAITAVLVGASAGVGVATDRSNARRASTAAATATIASPIEVDTPVSGNVSSIWGDININQPVRGDVASVFGHVAARAPVDGSVLVGSGQFSGDPALVAKGVVTDLDQRVLASSVPALNRVTWSPQAARTAVVIVGTVLLLVLLGLSSSLWPDPLARASAALAAQPGPSLGLGLLLLGISALLLGPFVVLLSWSVVGLLSLPLLAVFLHLPVIFGVAVAGGTVALRMFGRATLRQTLLANGILLLSLFALALVVPWLGAVALYVVASVGFGAMLLSTRQAAVA